MSQTIRIKRGTKEQLINYGPLETGELGFCTDTKEVYIGSGTDNTLVGAAMQGVLTSRPGPSNHGRFYYVTTGQNAGYLYFDDGSSWHRVNALALTDLTGNLDDIADGTSYKKVVAGDITDGHVNKVSDSVNTTTAAEIRTHIDDPSIHRKINDSGIAATDLWSAQKTKTEIFNAIRGMDWQDSVKSMTTATPPASPQLHERYLIPEDAAGIWAGKAGMIADWNGSSWDFLTASTGWAAYVEDKNKNYTYNLLGQWVPTGGANQSIEAGKGLIGGGSYDTVSLDIGAGNGIEVTDDAVSVKAYNGITVDSNGVAVNIDNRSITFDASNGNKLTVSLIDGGTFTRA